MRKGEFFLKLKQHYTSCFIWKKLKPPLFGFLGPFGAPNSSPAGPACRPRGPPPPPSGEPEIPRRTLFFAAGVRLSPSFPPFPQLPQPVSSPIARGVLSPFFPPFFFPPTPGESLRILPESSSFFFYPKTEFVFFSPGDSPFGGLILQPMLYNRIFPLAPLCLPPFSSP